MCEIICVPKYRPNTIVKKLADANRDTFDAFTRMQFIKYVNELILVS